MIPYDVPVTQPGSAVHQNTSSACRSRASRAVAWCATTASCTCIAPFGVPVVPLVKCSSASWSGSVGAISNVVRGVAPTTQSKSSASGEHARARGRAPRAWIGSTLRRYSAAVVTSTRASPRRRRWRIGSGPNAENSGDTTAPSFSAPSTATCSSGTRPSSVYTRSPGATPSDRSALAKRLVSSSSSP